MARKPGRRGEGASEDWALELISQSCSLYSGAGGGAGAAFCGTSQICQLEVTGKLSPEEWWRVPRALGGEWGRFGCWDTVAPEGTKARPLWELVRAPEPLSKMETAAVAQLEQTGTLWAFFMHET